MNLTPIKCTINGQMRELMVDPRTSLLELLRSEGLTSIKQACAVGECGACTALIDGIPIDMKPRTSHEMNCCILI